MWIKISRIPKIYKISWMEFHGLKCFIFRREKLDGFFVSVPRFSDYWARSIQKQDVLQVFRPPRQVTLKEICKLPLHNDRIQIATDFRQKHRHLSRRMLINRRVSTLAVFVNVELLTPKYQLFLVCWYFHLQSKIKKNIIFFQTKQIYKKIICFFKLNCC